MKRQTLLLAIVVLSLASCIPSTKTQEIHMPIDASIRSINFPQAFFKPGEPARWSVSLHSSRPVRLNLVTTVRYLADVITEVDQPVEFGPGELTLNLSWQPEAIAPRGYGLDVTLQSEAGDLLTSRSSGFDVLERWTQHPRYGFLTDFEPNRNDASAALDWLLGYHINGLQFYDWMYRHDQYLTDEEPYIDPLGRLLSLQTVNQLIADAHERGMAAMPYTAVYAASFPFYEQHKNWSLLQPDGKPHYFGENFLVIMDPRPGSPWAEHLLGEFDRILQNTGFDGIHLDQYGAPKEGYDAQGNRFLLDQPLADLIDATKAITIDRRGQDGAVVFNAVTNWPIETVAPSDQDLVYIEVWPPYTFFNDLGHLIVQAQQLGGGKPVVIAAYIDSAFEVNARLNDAIIFANGAGHIELGEQGGYLSDPYFPKFSLPSPDLAGDLRRYYEFALRYQNLIGPTTQSADADFSRHLTIEGIETSANLVTDRVMPVFRVGPNHLALNLINLLGLDTGEWATGATIEPTPIEAVNIELTGVTRQVKGLWFATPDEEKFDLQSLTFSQSDDRLQFTLPSLRYWDLIVIEWSDAA